ncbi:uncharacterized protein LOC105184884 [Harpegnathos saltator]|uniref:uncharacterized protein LOC105184884 n=1 Tax=Harpegnathos saltator TaxID=610380 RepID=UPI000DBEDC26|nr:uncharacterized protein LOC105184884 [Harpegnathos saltator]
MNVENFTPVLSWTSTLQKAERNTYTSVSNAKEVEQEIDGIEHSNLQSPQTETIVAEVSDSTPLTEATAKQLIALLNVVIGQGKLPLMNGCNVNKEESNIEAIGQDIHLGHNISVTKTAYEEIQRVKEPSKFVTNLAYAV